MWKFFIATSFLISAQSFAEECNFAETWVDEYSIGKIKFAFTSNDCELQTDLHLKKNSLVQWWFDYDRLMKVSEIAAPFEVQGRYRVNEGASIVWHKSGKLSYLSHFTEDTEVQPGVWARAKYHPNVSSAVNWDRDGKVTWVQVLARPIVDSNGKILAQECQTAFLQDGIVINSGDLYDCR